MSRKLLLSVGYVFALGVPSAMANQPPGPALFMAEIIILPLMLLLSFTGGYYALWTKGEAVSGSNLTPSDQVNKSAGRFVAWKWIAVIIAIVLSGAHEFIACLLTWLFCAMALYRGIRMLKLSGKKTISLPEQALHRSFSMIRLKVAGLILAVLSIFFAAQALAFLGYWPDIGQSYREKRFRQLVTFQMAYSQFQQSKTGQPKFHRFAKSDPRLIQSFYACSSLSSEPGGITIDYGPNDRSFTAFLLPDANFPLPFFPFNYLTSQPSLRADESGRIRMIRVHHNYARCPPDAPVVIQITSNEVAAMKKELDSSGGLQFGS